MNSLNIIGRLTRDPEIRQVGDYQVAQFDIATDVGTKAKPRTMFLPCKAWEKTSELIRQYVFKGHRIGLSGHLDMEQWEDKQSGAKRSKILLVVDRVDLLQPRGDGDQRPANTEGYGEEPQTRSDPAETASSAFDGEEVPF